MSAMYTQVDGTGNHIKVLDAQSTLVEWALAAISATVRSHPCNPCSLFTASLAHVSATTPRMGAPGASPPLAHPKKGSRQKLLCGADSTRSPATKSVCPGSTRFCAHAAQRFPLAAHQQGSSRHRSRSGGCLESNVDRHPLRPSILCAMQEAQRPASHRKLRLRPLWAGAAACRGVRCAGTGTGTGTEETNRRRAISHSLECVSHTLRKCNVMPDGEDADRWL